MAFDETIRTLMKQLVGEGARAPSVELLRQCWPTLVGVDLARRSAPKSWRRGQLVVEVANNAWLQELSYRQAQLQRRVERYLPWELEAIKLVVASGPFEPAMEPAIEDLRRKEPVPPSSVEGLEQDQREDLDRLDEDLRDTLLRIHAQIPREDDSR